MLVPGYSNGIWCGRRIGFLSRLSIDTGFGGAVKDKGRVDAIPSGREAERPVDTQRGDL